MLTLSKKKMPVNLDLIKKSLLSTVCWSVIGGAGNGTVISLAFGEKVRRAKALGNSRLTEEERLFEGEFSLFVECAWRLQTQEAVLCTSLSSNHEGGSRNNELMQLVGKHVVNLDIRLPGGDLEITFEGGRMLAVFADQANEVDECGNYTFHSPEYVMKNGCKSSVSVLPRT